MILRGLKNCDKTRAARIALPQAKFLDIREDPLTDDEIARVLDSHGAAAINRSSTTWRGLDEAARAQDPAALLRAHPTLLKRPAIFTKKTVHVGWTPAVREALGLTGSEG
jgi:arsenate reductase